MENCDNFLKEIYACREAREWAKGKNIAQIWTECERGDWMLWLAAKVGVDNRILTAAKAECAALALPYMKDPRSIAAVEAARAYGMAEIGDVDLSDASDAASDAYAYAAYAAYAAAAYAASAYATGAEKRRILLKCAEIVRGIISVEIIQEKMT